MQSYFSYWKMPIERQLEDFYGTEWELFAIDLQRLLVDVEDVDVLFGGGLFHSRMTEGKSKSAKVIRHPQVDKYKRAISHSTQIFHNVTFTQEGYELNVVVTMTDGTERERRFAIGLRNE